MSPERPFRGSSGGRSRGRGRGAYYKARYGNRGAHQPASEGRAHAAGGSSRDWAAQQQQLFGLLQSMDGKQYGHYKQLTGRHFDFDMFSLTFDSVQTDAYAPPSRIRVR
ncbi:hypothetical protein IWW55_006880, partial [Coemansia sp. RSA 2706]